MPYSTEDWDRFEKVLDDARVAHGLDWKDVAELAGLSVEGIRMLRRGLVDEPRASNLSKLEATLRLPLGTLRNVLRDPDFPIATAKPEPEPEPEPEAKDPYVADLEQRYGLDPENASAAAVLIRALQRKRGNSPDRSKKEA